MTQALAPYPMEYFVTRFYGADKARSQMYKQERARILAYKQRGAVLDVGCGMGDFLAGFSDQWRKFGIEPSKYAAGEAFRHGIEIIPDIADMGVKSVDLVIYRGTIQHIDEPFGSLKKSIMALKEDGLLVFLATPNADSICYRLWGDLPALDPEHNFWIPSARTLTNALTNLGMTVIRIEYPYRATPYAKPLHDLGCFIGRLFGRRAKFAWPKNMMEVYAVKG